MPQVDFYVLNSEEEAARVEFCARLCEKALHNGLCVFVLTPNENTTAAVSDALWQLRADAFLPNSTANQTKFPILVDHTIPKDIALAPDKTLLINLHEAVPERSELFARIAELVVQQPQVLRITRAHFTHYKQLGLSPNTHKV